VPPGDHAALAGTVDDLKYQHAGEVSDKAAGDELLTLKLRYKEPEGDRSELMESVVTNDEKTYAQASEDFRFAAAVAGFGLMLRDSQHKSDLTLAAVQELAEASRGADENGYRTELIELVKKAGGISK
jgi:Ca-activated chloride channel homolog